MGVDAVLAATEADLIVGIGTTGAPHEPVEPDATLPRPGHGRCAPPFEAGRPYDGARPATALTGHIGRTTQQEEREPQERAFELQLSLIVAGLERACVT